MKQKKLLALMLSLVLICTVFSACSSSAKTSYAVTEDCAAVEVPAAVEEYGFGGANGTYAESEEIASEEPQAQIDTDTLAEKIIYSADISMQTQEFDATLRAIESEVSAIGGFIESSNVDGNSYYESDGSMRVMNRYAYYTVRIPCKQFDAFVGKVGTLGNVTSSSRNAENVTASYTDLEAKLTSLKTQEERLLAMLEKATDVETLVALEERLSEVRYETESVQSTLTNFDRRISYSSVSISISEVSTYTHAVSKTRTFGQRLADAFRAGWLDFGDALGEIFLWFVSALPMLIVLAVVIIVICTIVSRKKKARKAKKEAEKTE